MEKEPQPTAKISKQETKSNETNLIKNPYKINLQRSET